MKIGDLVKILLPTLPDEVGVFVRAHTSDRAIVLWDGDEHSIPFDQLEEL